MDVFVIQILEGELSGSGSYVAISVKVSFHLAILACDQRKAPNVKFSLLIQQWIVNVLLQDHCLGAVAVRMDEASNLVDVLLHFDAVSSV